MTMSRAYIITCDVCKIGITIEAEYKPAASEQAQAVGWLEMYGRHYCPDCMDVNQHMAREAMQRVEAGG